ncbi:glycosyltransferase [Cellulomonas xiejunii]|uniref:Glycosyltransferase n=1 Tax=Cellulomonas xiejunii TaxID=2968083 RepID=A0ABY5KQC2_9CELL|nr:glycosyltransferase [Cellulomonas xiejunii]MCC2320216.1 glycosyltransferase [Cellulomonas xiejunii]UUI70523.1 glycosyltransferase [Cellulomonas xiejunii]
MRIAIVAPSPVPFGPGGAEALWAGLYHQLLADSPHDVELLKVPVRETDLPEVMAAYESFTSLDLTHFDMVITGKYPAWMVQHPRHVVYMLHPLRGLYDSYRYFGEPTTVDDPDPRVRALVDTAAALRRSTVPALFAQFSEAVRELGPAHPALRFPGPLARSLVHALDRVGLSEASRYLAISRTVAEREGYFPTGAQVSVVHPPSDLTGLHEEPGEYFFTASRHDAPKRLDLLVRAMAHYPGSRRLVIAGTGPETPRLAELAAGDPRIELVGRVSQEELVTHYARAIGVPFIPVDEDLGLITYEAMRSGKPVLTASDSGGPTEFVRPGLNGAVVEPTPRAVGRGLAEIERLAGSPRTAELARRAVSHISWSHVADALTAPPARPVAHHADRASGGDGRPRLVVTSTFPVWPPRNGGQLRAYHLYRELADQYDVHIVCQAATGTVPSARLIAPGMTEHVVPRTREHHDAEQRITDLAALPVTDIVAGRLSALTPEYARTLADLLRGAAAVLLADPFMYPVVADVRPESVPVIYDAYNCELHLKTQMLPHTTVRDELLDEVRRVEAAACDAASLVLTVSQEDAAQLRALYGTPAEKFAAAPNGVDLRSVPYTPMAARVVQRDRWLARLRALGAGSDLRHVAMFVGSWHLPNIEAAEAICAMAPEVPDTAFVLLGSHTGALRRRVTPPNVFPLGVVSDAAKLTMLAAADVALAPLMTGSGTNLKVVEYLAAGVPVVSTPVGLRGLRMPEGTVQVSALGDFPEMIGAVLARSATADSRSELARRAVEAAYDWSAVADGVRDRLESVLVVPAP